MNNTEFRKVLENRITAVRNRFAVKSEQYASDYDVLSHFKRVAGILTDTPEMGLMGEAVKHLVKILQSVESVRDDRYPFSQDDWDEILTDFIVYLLLLDGQLCERYHWTVNTPGDLK